MSSSSTDFDDTYVFNYTPHCPGCNEIYRVTDINNHHIPLVLDCYHSCCESCIRQAIFSEKRRVVVCRKCGHKSVLESIKDLSRKNLRDRFPVADFIVQKMRAREKPGPRDESQINFSFAVKPKRNVDTTQPAFDSDPLCNECLVDEPVVICNQCGGFRLCRKCSDEVHNRRTLKHHVLIPLTEDAASCASDTSSSVYHKVKDLEHQQILRQLFHRSELKMQTIAQSLEDLQAKRAVYQTCELHYDKLEKDINGYFEQISNLVTRKRNEVLKSLSAAKNSWRISSRIAEKELTTLDGNLKSTTHRLRMISKLDFNTSVGVSEHMKRIDDLLQKNDLVVIEPPKQPQKEFKFTFDWIKQMEKELDFDFGSSGSVFLRKAEGDTNMPVHHEMMHPNYDYSDSHYDFNHVQVSPTDVHRTTMVPENCLSYSVESTPTAISDGTENRSVSSHHGTPDLFPSKSEQRLVPKKESVASQISSTSSSAVPCSRVGSADHSVLSRPLQKSRAIYSTKFNSSKMKNKNEASLVALPNAAVEKPKPPYARLNKINWMLSKDAISNVSVSHVVNPTCFYVQLPGKEDYFAFFDDEFSTAPNWPVPAFSEIDKGTLCITAKPGDGDRRHRVRIKNLADEKQGLVTVFYLDYGWEEVVHLSDLRLPKGGKKKPIESSALAVYCGLYDCYPRRGVVWKEDAIESFKSYILGKRLDLHINKRAASKFEVDLMIHGKFVASARQLLLDSGKATVCSQIQNVVPLHFSDELSYLYDTDFQLHKWIGVRISHIASPGDFYAQRDNSDAALQKLCKSMDVFYQNENNLKAAAIINPYVGQRIAAKYRVDNLWYRAEILKINQLSSKKFIVKYVDYGNVEAVSEKFIAKLDSQFFKVTVQAFRCSLRDISPLNNAWEPKVTETFKQLVENTLLQMMVLEVKQDNVLAVSLFKTAESTKNEPVSVPKLLIQKGLARGVGELAGVKTLVKTRKKRTQSKKVKNNRAGVQNGNEKSSETAVTKATTEDDSSEILDEGPSDVAADTEEDVEKRGPPAHMCEVQIKSIYNPNKVFLHFLEKCPNPTSMTTDLKIFYENIENNKDTMVETIEQDRKYAVFLEEDSKWYRCKVLSCSDDEDEVKVDLIDFVEKKAMVTKDNIRKLPDMFMTDMDAVVKCALVDFDKDHENWSPEFCDKIHAELAKYKELYVDPYVDRRVHHKIGGTGIENVALWGRNVKQGGPLDPRVEKWTYLNKKFLKMEQNDEAEDVNSESSSEDYKPVEASVQIFNEETGSPDPKKHIEDWLESTKINGNCINYSDMVNGDNRGIGPENQDPVSDGTIGGDEDEILESISTIEQETERIEDWLDPPELDVDQFIGKVTHVDWDFNLYIQIIERSHAQLEMISCGLKSVFHNSVAKLDCLKWRPGEICIAWWQYDKKWYRARVKQIKSVDNTVEVEYVDYGTDACVDPKHLRKEVRLLDVPIQCYKLALRSDLKPTSETGKWTQSVLDLVHGVIVEKNCDVFLRREPGENFYRVEKLILLESQMDLVSYLVSLSHAVYSDPIEVDRPTKRVMVQVEEESDKDDDESRTGSSDIPAIESVLNKNLLLEELKEDFEEASMPKINCWTVSQNPQHNSLVVSYFNVPAGVTRLTIKVTEVVSVTEIVINIISSETDPAIEEGYKTYHKMAEELQMEASRFPKLASPDSGQICCTQFADGVWYRGLVIARPVRNPQRVPVFYIDYGNVSFTSVSDLRELKEDWYHIPMQSVKCIIKDIELPESKSEIERFGEELSNALLNQEFTAIIEALQVDERVFSIRLLNEDDVPPYHSIWKSRKS